MTDNTHVYHGMYQLAPSEYGGHSIRTCRLMVDGMLLPITPPPGMTSPTAFDWLSGSKGRMALAYTLLAHELGLQLAAELYYDFERDVIANLPRVGSAGHWDLTNDQIHLWRRLYGEVQVLLRRLKTSELFHPLPVYA